MRLRNLAMLALLASGALFLLSCGAAVIEPDRFHPPPGWKCPPPEQMSSTVVTGAPTSPGCWLPLNGLFETCREERDASLYEAEGCVREPASSPTSSAGAS